MAYKPEAAFSGRVVATNDRDRMAYRDTAEYINGCRAVKALVDLIEAQPAPPCDEFKCEERKRCASFGLACEAFSDYVATGLVRARVPSNKKDRPTARRFENLGLMMPNTKLRGNAAAA